MRIMVSLFSKCICFVLINGVVFLIIICHLYLFILVLIIKLIIKNELETDIFKYLYGVSDISYEHISCRYTFSKFLLRIDFENLQ